MDDIVMPVIPYKSGKVRGTRDPRRRKAGHTTSIAVRFEPELFEKVAALAHERKVSFASVVRVIVRSYMEECE